MENLIREEITQYFSEDNRIKKVITIKTRVDTNKFRYETTIVYLDK